MLETIPAAVVVAIYAYFVAVLAVGLYLHGRIWLDYRRRSGSRAD